LQVVASVRGVCGGTAEKYIAKLAEMDYCDEVKPIIDLLVEGTEILKRSAAYIKKAGIDYMELYGRNIVDIAIDIIIGYLFCSQASTEVVMETAVSGSNGDSPTISMAGRKTMVARRFITKNAVKIRALGETIASGNKSTFNQYEALVGPVPEEL